MFKFVPTALVHTQIKGQKPKFSSSNEKGWILLELHMVPDFLSLSSGEIGFCLILQTSLKQRAHTRTCTSPGCCKNDGCTESDRLTSALRELSMRTRDHYGRCVAPEYHTQTDVSTSHANTLWEILECKTDIRHTPLHTHWCTIWWTNTRANLASTLCWGKAVISSSKGTEHSVINRNQITTENPYCRLVC